MKMSCAVTSIFNVFIHHGRFIKTEAIESRLKIAGCGAPLSSVEGDSVKSVFDFFNLEASDHMGDIFMPFPYILNNGTSWASCVPYIDKKSGKYMMEVDIPKQKLKKQPFHIAKRDLKKDGYCGGFFITKKPPRK